MAIKPILFNTEMVRAILDGKKTCTRIIVKPQPTAHYGAQCIKPPYQPGDILYVRETWSELSSGYEYKADGENIDHLGNMIKWKPSIRMPKEAARIFLKVTDVRVERLQEITEDGAKAEGINEEWAMSWWSPTYYDPDSGGYPKYRDTFAFEVWNKTIKKSDIGRYGWYANPWVWVIEFERCEKPEGV